jgi:hypothetical protein
MDLMSQADAHLYRAKITRNAVGSSRTGPPAPRRADAPEPASTAP